ncbi:conserved hypothetical protein [Aspergillus terreus NIH2624]|uniref:Uncharacterized protein n=1 Tax=Aspergillus terreus (strain NIH 2624 / FGSC A1156) TaxID=341663 RepID=Q0D058_ASPTN|nr:uncharacterized protein ATEG_00676 [Aspergillus terreus NIH2624]EAU39322.1 conserved hypothetical protein [Aspergillus terreus NIH2624]
MHTLQATASSSLSLAEGNYIYSIAPASPGSFAAISSDDSLRVFDAAGLARVSVVAADTHTGVTSLRSYSVDQQLLATGGRDGKVKLWDLRSGKKNSAVMEVETCKLRSPRIVGSLLPPDQQPRCGNRAGLLPGHRSVLIPRPAQTPLQYHPTRPDIFLSGSTDGLVNIYNTTIADEDDALVQVINHGSVHHAGFLTEKTIYALSHDEVFSIHPATDPDEQTQEPDPVQFGDLRQPLDCEYIAQLCIGSQGPYIAAGNKMDKRLDLIPLVADPTWRFDQENLWRLPGGHGEEVVRSVYLDEQSVFTGGEDGFVRVWKAGGEEMETESPVKASRPEKKNKEKGRFRPY